MGIDYDSHLIIGWILDKDKLRKTAAKIKKPNCCTSEDDITNATEYELCFCTLCTQECIPDIPAGWHIVTSSPFYDSSNADYVVCLSIINPSAPQTMSVTELKNYIEDTALMKRGRDFAKRYGYEDGDEEAHVFSLPHIW